MKIILNGATGAMGKKVIQVVSESDSSEIVAAVSPSTELSVADEIGRAHV